MVYETDFYTSRRPYRASPSLSTYTVTCEPSRQVRLLPGLGKVHVVHSYDRIIPYIGHKRLTVVTHPPSIIRLRPSTLYREFDRIENKLRPYSYNSYTNDYLNSNSHVRIIYVRNPITGSLPVYRHSTLYTSRYDPYFLYRSYYPTYYYPSYLDYYPTYYSPLRSYYNSRLNFYPSARWLDLALYPSWRYNHFARMFDDETRAIRAQINTFSNQLHSHVPRKLRALPLPYHCRYEETPARWCNDNFVHKMVCSSPSHSAEYTTYWSDPVRRQFSSGRLACVSIVGGKSHPRRKNIYVFNDDPVRSDIQLLSYYINRFREEKKAKNPISVRVILPPLRPTRVFSVPRPLEDAHMDSEETMQMKQERVARLAKLNEINPDDLPKIDVKAKLAEEKAKREATLMGVSKKAALKQKEEDAARQAVVEEENKKKEAEAEAVKKEAEEAAAKKAAEEEASKKAAEEEAAKKAAEEAKAKKAAEEAKAKEEAAKKEKEAKEAAAKAAELERLAEQARQEELAKQAEIEKAKKEEEDRQRLEEEKRQAEAAKAEDERQQLLRLEEIARQAEEEKEAELARQAEELAELARQEAELAEKTKAEEDIEEQQRKEADAAELALKEAELAELETKERELTEQAEQARAEADVAAVAAVTAEAAEATPGENETATQEATDEPIIEEPESPAPAEDATSEDVQATEVEDEEPSEE